jgi:hypothetical protein
MQERRDPINTRQTLDGYFRKGPSKETSKYLVETAGELTVKAASIPPLEE